MGKNTSVFLAIITSTTVGAIIFQALGVFILGLIGALAGWVFQEYVRPKLDKWKNKK